MRFFCVVLASLIVAASGQAQQEQGNAIRFPAIVQPAVPVNPLLPVVLSGDLLYVFESDTPHVAFCSPANICKIVEKVGPVSIFGKFVDGAGKAEFRDYKGKQVWIVVAAGTGKAELLVVPSGVTKPDQVVRKPLDVYADIAPQPPPDPGPKPEPEPQPTPAPIPIAGFRVLFVEETSERAKLTTDQFNAMFGKVTRDWLDANCVKENGQPGYRIYDKDVNAKGDLKHWQDALSRPRTAVPWIVISNGLTGFEGPLPATKAEIDSLLQKHKGK